MTTPEWFLAGFAILAVWSVADAIWRLWRRRPGPYGTVWSEFLLLFTLVVVTLNDHAWGIRNVITKVIIIAAFTTATVLRLIARKRFAVES